MHENYAIHLKNIHLKGDHIRINNLYAEEHLWHAMLENPNAERFLKVSHQRIPKKPSHILWIKFSEISFFIREDD